jgi:hypothetical protein
VFLAGLGAVIAAALALAAVFFGLAAFAVGFRRIWPLPAQAGRASKASGAPEVRDAQQPAAVAAAAPVYTWPAMETAYEDQSRENRVAVELRAKIADVETVAKTRIDQGYSLFKRHYEELGARQGALERELGRLRNEIERRFRVRDAARVLMELRAELEPLGERLLIGERTEFPNAEAWQVAYRKWHEQTKNFWLVAT